jgi:hypothetical protein
MTDVQEDLKEIALNDLFRASYDCDNAELRLRSFWAERKRFKLSWGERFACQVAWFFLRMAIKILWWLDERVNKASGSS